MGSRGGKQAAAAPGPGQGLPSSPEGSQAARDSCELSGRTDPLTQGEAPREGPVLERGGRPVPTAVRHRGAGPAGCGHPAGCGQGPRGASICWAVWQAWGAGEAGVGGSGKVGGPQGQAGDRAGDPQGGVGGVQGGSGQQEGFMGGGQRAGWRWAVTEGRGSFQDSPPRVSPVSGLHGAPHLDEFHGPARWGKRGQRPQCRCP